MVIEHAVAGADDRLAISDGIPRQAKARGHVVVIARYAFDNPEGLFRCGVHRRRRSKQRADFDIVAHPIIDGEMPVQEPAFLLKERYGVVVERLVGVPDSFDVGGGHPETVRLDRGGAGQGDACDAVRKAKSGRRKPAKIHITAEVEFENLRLVGAQLDEVEIASDLESVAATDKRQVVCEFEAALDAIDRRIRLAAEVRGPGNIDADVGAAGKLRIAKMQAPAGNLRAEFVERSVA